MAPEGELRTDPTCERCDAPLVDTRPAVVREAQTYCCVNCARADDAEVKVATGTRAGRACSRCGAPIVDPRHAVAEGTHVFCCANCSAVGIHAEPEPLPGP